MYLVKAPRWLKWMYPGFTWDMPVGKDEKTLYLSFDDGPHPIATPFVLEQLKQFNAKATFFCIGKNVADHTAIYQKIIEEGHSIGNHTHNHLNGWKVTDKEYINDIAQAAELIDSKLFRPPYGRITKFQARVLAGASPTGKQGFSIIMWSVLAADWDHAITVEKCYDNIILNAKPGSIIVFHDSAKALERMQYVLPKVLDYYSRQGYQFKAIQA